MYPAVSTHLLRILPEDGSSRFLRRVDNYHATARSTQKGSILIFIAVITLNLTQLYSMGNVDSKNFKPRKPRYIVSCTLFTLKMEAVYSTETFVCLPDFSRHSPEESNFPIDCRENSKRHRYSFCYKLHYAIMYICSSKEGFRLILEI
jgi:hypothetical protein